MRIKNIFRRGVVLFLLLALITGIGYSPAASGSDTGVPIAAAKKKKPAFNEKKALKKIKITYMKTDRGILVTFKNNYIYKVDISYTMHFEDANGNDFKSENIVNKAFSKGTTMVYFFEGPKNDTNEYIHYSAYVPQISVQKSTTKSFVSYINVFPTIEPGQTKVLAMNLAPQNLNSVNVTFVFYNAANEYMGAETQFLQCTAANTSREFYINMVGYPYTPARVEVYKNWAY